MRKSKGKRSENGSNFDEEDDEPLVASKEDDGKEYEVDQILKTRKKGRKTEYLVRWKGFSKKDDTWEAEDQLNCPELIEAFKASEEDEEEVEVCGGGIKNKRGGKRKKEKKNQASKKKKNTQSDEDEENSDKEYEVEKILEVHHKKNGDREFLVRWKGYSKNDDTWEPENNLSCPDLISAFLEKVSKAKEATPRETRVNRKATDRYVVNARQAGRKLSNRTTGNRRTYYDE